MILALVMALALVACGNKNTDDDEQNDTPTVITNPDEVQDEMTSSDGKYEVAFVTDVGQLKDKSFNQGTYDGVKLYAANNNLSYKYYQPANGSEGRRGQRRQGGCLRRLHADHCSAYGRFPVHRCVLCLH